jgi:plastocyanin
MTEAVLDAASERIGTYFCSIHPSMTATIVVQP